MTKTLSSLHHAKTFMLAHSTTLITNTLALSINNYHIHIRSNTQKLLDTLQHYFHSCQVVDTSKVDITPDCTLVAIDQAPLTLSDISFTNWPREEGKTGRKDEYYDLADGRLIRKVRTGMLFLQSTQYQLAIGPCLQYPNQIINFINSQYMNYLQQKKWLICHAAGLSYQRKGLAIAGFSGGGKSTLMLELMNNPEVNYITNDRLFIHKQQICGIPKLPRINPGTIVANPRLQHLLSSQQLKMYQDMELATLWEIEKKYDVYIRDIYGTQRISFHAPLYGVVLLNWQHNSSEETTIRSIDLSHRLELLQLLMKSSGPFYQDAQGQFLHDINDLNTENYLNNLASTPIYEVTGKIDFLLLAKKCIKLLH